MKIAVLMGGRSGEHEVSLRSGAAVVRALAKSGHEAWPMTLGRDGGARWPGGEGRTGEGLAALEAAGVDAAFIAMHGPDGEDGRMQGALELLGIPYQGSGVQASAIGLDKVRTKQLLRAAGLPLAEERLLQGAVDWQELAVDLGLPLVLKTPASGSSVGVEVVTSLGALEAKGPALLGDCGDRPLLAERYVAGREFTLPVVERPDGTPEGFPVVEIRPRTAAFFDYEAKYTPGATDEVCPAPISGDLEARLRALGCRAHEALGCRGYSRTDCIVTDEGQVVLLEVNTLPGLTAESLLPKSAACAGLSFEDLVMRLIGRALAR
jgi:D-alanine-D-alanine ligase